MNIYDNFNEYNESKNFKHENIGENNSENDINNQNETERSDIKDENGNQKVIVKMKT